MTRTVRSCAVLFVTLGLFLILGVAGHNTRVRAELSRPSEPRRVMLNVSSSDGGYLRETHSIALQPGINRIRVRLDSTRFDRGSFLVVPGGSDVRVRRISFLDERTASVVLASPENTIRSVAFYARLSGLSNRSIYRATLSSNRDRMRLREDVVVFNRSGQSFEDTWLGVGFGSWLKTTIQSGDRKRIRLYQKANVPVSTRYRVDSVDRNLSNEFQPLPVQYVFHNTSEDHLGDRSLKDGKIRFYGGSDGKKSFLGEGRLRRTPVGDTVTVTVGKSNDVRARRVVQNRERTDVRRNNRRRIQLYDEVVTVEYTVKNQSDRPADVVLNETMSGEWELVESTHPHSVPSNSVLRVTPTVPEDSIETIRVTIRKLNEMPKRQ